MSNEQRLPHDGANYRLDEAMVSERDGVLRANDYDDVYFAARDGLAESRYVFLDGAGFAEKLQSQKHLTIAETGFGSGLNFLAVLDVLQKFPDCQIDYISFESRPLPAGVIARTHAGFPCLAAQSAKLLNNLPPRWPGQTHQETRYQRKTGAVKKHITAFCQPVARGKIHIVIIICTQYTITL